MESANRIKSIVTSINAKLGAKTINLASAVKVLCGGYSATKGTSYTPITSNHPIASCKRILEILNGANKATGYNDCTVTSTVQRLCDGYTEQIPLYSFGALSDLHIQYATGTDDFARALTYLKDKVPFTCVCGDLVAYATAENMAQYKEYVDTYAGDMPLYECAGNHECYDYINEKVTDANLTGDLLDRWTSATGKETYYSFNYGNDVFIFLSLKSGNASNLFVDGGLTWLEQTLEANKGKRCFVFQHVQDPNDDGADPSHSYSPILSGTPGQTFLSLLRKYKNTVWFHGHTHVTFGVEQYPVSENLGYRSVHIPSLSNPRFYNAETNALEDYYFDADGNKICGSAMAEGYIVDVYENKIVLRGFNFAAGDNKDEVAALTDEVYVLDTTLQTV